MRFFNQAIWIFTAPAKVFADISEGRASWWQPWLLISVVHMVIGYLSMPIQLAVVETNPSNLSSEDLQQQIELTEKLGVIPLLGTPVAILLLGLVLAGIAYVVVSIMSTRSTFKQYFSLSFFAGIVTLPTYIISTAILLARGPEAIRSAEDAVVSISLRFLAPEDNSILRAVLSTFEFFSIWSLVILAMGVMAIFGLSRNQRIVAILPWWVISVIMALVGSFFGGLG